MRLLHSVEHHYRTRAAHQKHRNQPTHSVPEFINYPPSAISVDITDHNQGGRPNLSTIISSVSNSVRGVQDSPFLCRQLINYLISMIAFANRCEKIARFYLSVPFGLSCDHQIPFHRNFTPSRSQQSPWLRRLFVGEGHARTCLQQRNLERFITHLWPKSLHQIE